MQGAHKPHTHQNARAHTRTQKQTNGGAGVPRTVLSRVRTESVQGEAGSITLFSADTRRAHLQDVNGNHIAHLCKTNMTADPQNIGEKLGLQP